MRQETLNFDDFKVGDTPLPVALMKSALPISSISPHSSIPSLSISMTRGLAGRCSAHLDRGLLAMRSTTASQRGEVVQSLTAKLMAAQRGA